MKIKTPRQSSAPLTLGALLLGLASPAAHAVPLQIIHTNDLHSHLDHARDSSRGGYAAVKATIDQLKANAQAQGIDTLVLDAGDFSEDSQFYLADEGADTWKAMDAMGYDAVEIGNHDWLAGLSTLDQQVGTAQPSFALLGANFVFGWEYKNLVRYMHKSAEVVKAGAKIAILGLTTDDPQYSWMTRPGMIYKPAKEAAEDVPELRRRNDYVIALTHIGVDADVDLVTKVRGIDLVVGGHSHTVLSEARKARDPDGKEVQIVQTGMHGNFVGDLLVDVVPGKPLVVLHYNLVPVYSNGPKDETMQKTVDYAEERLEQNYGADWLHAVVGTSEVPLLNAYYQNVPTSMSDFIGGAIKEAGRADVAVDVTQFEGFDQPAGPITREQLFIMYPRIFEFTERYGYTVWTTEITGAILELAIKEAISLSMPVNLIGLTCDIDAKNNATNFRINGAPVLAFKSYRVAMPEALARGALGISKALGIFLRDARSTGIPIWQATETHFKTIGGVIHAPAPGPAPKPTRSGIMFARPG